MSLLNKVNRLIHSKLESLTDAQVFLSVEYKEFLERFLEIFARDHKRKLSLHLIDDPEISANTNGNDIVVSVTSEILEDYPARWQKSNAIKGFLVHEIGHVLFTDFPTYNAVQLSMAVNGLWAPSAPYDCDDDTKEAESLREMNDYLSQKGAISMAIVEYWKHILNIVEDAYIEMRMSDRYPGFSRYLSAINVLNYNRIGNLDDCENCLKAEKASATDKALKEWGILTNAILQYAKYGEISLADEKYSSPLLDTVYFCVPLIDNSILNPDALNRTRNVNKILVACWPYIKSLVDNASNDAKNCGADVQRAIEKALQQMLDQLPQTSSAPTNRNSTPVDCKTNDAQKARQNATNNSNASLPSGMNQNQQSQGKNENQGNGNNSDSSQNAQQPGSSGASNSGNDQKSSGGASNSGNDQKSSGGASNSGNDQKSSGGASNSGNDQKNSGGSGKANEKDEYESAMLDKIAKDLARNMAEEDVETQHLRELQSEIDGGGKDVTVKRPIRVTTEMQTAYKNFVAGKGKKKGENLLQISKKLQREMMQILKTQIDGGKQGRLPIGNRISTKDLVHDDEFIFSKNKAPQDKSDLAVCVLVDESGSMGGEKINAAIKTSIILEDFLRNMEIPCCIFGHTTDWSKCELMVYSDFDRADNKDKYRITNMSARGGTPTATAMKACYDHLKKRKETSKLLIVITDGVPGDNGEKQIQKLIRESHHHGIEIFGIGIANAAKPLKEIYGNRTIAIDDLNELPRQMVRLVKRFIRFV